MQLEKWKIQPPCILALQRIKITPPLREARKTAEGEYGVEMMRDVLPRLRISAEYESMLEDPETAKKARQYLAGKILWV